MSPSVDSNVDFHCYGCGHSCPARPRGACCTRCGEPYSLRHVGACSGDVFRSQPGSLWHYEDLLPVRSRDSVVSMGEGATRLIDAPRLAARLGMRQLLLKNETSNPTGSFKDRQVSVGISHARELGHETVAVVSSGNVACAAAAYAARSGMKAVLFMHGMAGGGKIAQAASYGAKVVKVDSPSARTVFDLCIEACDAFGWYHLSTAGMHEPYNVEGAKTIAYELFQQTCGDLPDWIVAPVGGGGLLGGIWRGLLDLKRLGLIETLPRLAGAQAVGCAPLKDAIAHSTPFLETLQHPWPNPHSVAGGIADDILFDGHTVLPAIRTTQGAAFAVTDEEILDAETELASTEGILCEPSSAAAIAALKHLRPESGSNRVCCIVTGTGIKDLEVLRGRVNEPIQIAPNLPDLAKVLGESL
ncbi:MAG: threonine synthase [Candidatus Hydrogenedentes bacterium]|nr:threonine synthase [Candidatus Hydrogenedentota bacterium]